MAEEAFALSPISARPSVPGEADYDAIREAFMETARGRWFLNEYAKRNRHTDTGMVLEAVTRLEASLKAQKQAPAVGLLESLAAIRSAVRHAKASAIEAMPRIETDETQTAARNGARIIREIASTMRECGADIRICDLLDTQMNAIDAAQLSAANTGRDDVLASYDLLMQRIEALVDGSGPVAAPAATEPVVETPAPPVAEAREASVTPLFKAPAAEVALVVEPEAVSAVEAPAVVAEAPAMIVESTAEIAATMAEASVTSAVEEIAATEPEAAALEAENAHDLAVLDMVAMEMAVHDPIEPEVTGPEMVQPAPQPETIAPETVEAPVSFAQIAEVSLAPEPPQPEPAAQEAPQPEAEASHHPSLGAALIANGVISNPNAPASDPLAPIRRMSQAEKIAFFS